MILSSDEVWTPVIRNAEHVQGAAYLLLQAAPCLTPSAASILASGQNPVNDDWKRLAPTKAVNHSQLGVWKCAISKLSNMKAPAMRMTH